MNKKLGKMTNKIKEKIKTYIKRNPKIYTFLIQANGNWCFPFLLIAWKIASLLVPRKNVAVDGIVLNLSCSNWITHFRWYLFKKKEKEVRYYINKHIKTNDIFFDIGANVGVFSLYCAKKINNVSVYSFEPEYSNLHILKENVLHNHLNINIFGFGISDFDGISTLHLQDVLPGAAAHTESHSDISKTDEGYDVVAKEGISVYTLDSICNQLGIVPNGMKIDTDGNEKKVLSGAKNTLLNKNLRSLILEMPSKEDDKEFCENILNESGFAAERDSTRNEIWVRVSD